MIENFEYYKTEGKVKKRSIDVSMARSLMELSKKHLEYIRSQKISKENARFLFKDIYDTIRESSQSLMCLRGFKPLSHEAIIAFLRDVMLVEIKYVDGFNRFRVLRNRVSYEAVDLDDETCNEAFEFLKEFLLMIKKIYVRELK
jgi:hypothetical protein